MLGFAAGESRTLGEFRRCYNSTANEAISPGGFYQRLTPTLAEHLRDLVERGLDEVAVPNAVDADLDRKYIYVEIEVGFKRGPYNGMRSLDTERFRVVGVRDEDVDDYHLYMTNLAREEFFPADLAEIYRCRWEAELLFRELKTHCELDEFGTSDGHVVKILSYATLLLLLVNRDLLDIVTEQAGNELVLPTERWAATFRSHAQLILHELSEYLGYPPPPLLKQPIEDAQEIHKQRLILQEILATATQPGCEA